MAKEEESVASTKKTKTRKGWKIARTVIAMGLVIGLIAFGGYYFKKYNDLKKNPISSQEAQQEENDRILAAVGKLYTLPQDEKPTIFFVSDKEKFSDEYKKQEFFQKAINGDYILIYDKAKLAILYRPTENRLVDVRPYTVQTTLSVGIIGAEADRENADKVLKTAFKDQVNVVTKTAAKSAYTTTTIVDLSGKYATEVAKIAESLKGKVGELPAGESKPQGVDILVITGSPEVAPPAAQ